MYDKNNIFELTFKNKLFLTLLGLFFFTLAFFIAVSSLTFDFDETGWRVLSSTSNKNFFGILGSYISGFLYKEFGILTPFFLFLIFILYGFKYLKHQIIPKFWFKFILILILIVFLGLLSQPLHKILSNHFFEENLLCAL